MKSEIMSGATIIVIDDETGIVQLCDRLLTRAGYQVLSAMQPEEGLKLLESHPADLLMVDIRMPGMDGFKVLEAARQKQPDLAVLMITGYGTMDTAIEALRRGADGLTLKPFTTTELLQSVEYALEQNRVKREMSRLQALRPLFEFSASLFAETSPNRLRLLLTQVACRAIHCDGALLFEGKSGTRPPRSNHASLRTILSSQLKSTAWHKGGEIEPGLACAFTEAVQPFVQRAAESGQPVSGQVSIKPAGMQDLPATFSILCAPAPLHTRAKGKPSRRVDMLAAVGASQPRSIRAAEQSPSTVIVKNSQLVLVILQRSDGSSPKSQPIGAADEELLVILSRQGAAALENAFLAGELRSHIRQLEESQRLLVQAEKMAATGRLMASIAHEINNPLQAMQNCLHLARRSDLSEGKTRSSSNSQQEYLEMAQSELQRLMNTVHRMLDFYRPTAQDREPTDIHAVLQRVMQLSDRQLTAHHITVRVSLDPAVPKIPAIADQVQQVFINLVLNAIEAMPEGGKIEITTRVLDGMDAMGESSSKKNRSRMTEPKGEIEILFSDDGPGIPADIKKHIFEPFTSTKTGGTGLGLSISYGIIAAHGGTLELLENKPGASFRIRLPADAQPGTS